MEKQCTRRQYAPTVPETSYASCGDLSLAYQVFGDGPIELVVAAPGPYWTEDLDPQQCHSLRDRVSHTGGGALTTPHEEILRPLHTS